MSNIEIVYDANCIAECVDQLAERIAQAVPADVVIVALLKGACMFAADLTRALDGKGMTPYLEFIQVSSYGLNTKSSGNVQVLGGMPKTVAGRNVLLVDDIQDTGRTLQFTKKLLIENGAKRIWTCALLDKPDRRLVDFEADFVGFTIPDVFVIGYGIDYAESFRHLPYIGLINDLLLGDIDPPDPQFTDSRVKD